MARCPQHIRKKRRQVRQLKEQLAKRQARDVLPSGQYASAGSRILEVRAIGKANVDWSYRRSKVKRAQRIILTVP